MQVRRSHVTFTDAKTSIIVNYIPDCERNTVDIAQMIELPTFYDTMTAKSLDVKHIGVP